MKHKYLIIGICLTFIIILSEKLAFLFGNTYSLITALIIGFILGEWAFMKDKEEENE